MILWLIDDTPQHHDTAAATVAQVPGVRFVGFRSAEEGVAAFRAAVRNPRHLPDAVLMDFFLGDGRGDEVTARLRRLEPPGKRPVIIGYSSMPSASAAIVEAGGDLVLKKQCDDTGINPTLLAWLRQALP